MTSETVTISVARGSVMNLLRRLHFYIGLFIAPFIFVAALTGTLYVLTPQLENHLYAEALVVQPHSQAASLTRQIAAARAYVGETQPIYAVRPAPGPSDTTRVQFSDSQLGASESRAIFIDPYTLEVKGDMTVYGTSGVLPLRMWLDQLHRGLLLGDVGRIYSELAASWLWVAALGGVALWFATRPKRKVKPARGGFARTRHWHLTLGIFLLGGLLFFSVTGLTWSQWAGSNIDKMRTSLNWLTPQVNTQLNGAKPAPPADPHAEHHTTPAMAPMSAGPVNRSDADWERALAAARAAGIDAARVELRQPKSAGTAWTVTEVDRSWPSQVDAVSVNPDNFAIVDQVWFDRFPLVAKLTRWGVDAHMGVLFGLPNQLILALFGFGLCAMIVLGYRMWWLRRPAVGQNSAAQTLTGCWLALSSSGKVVWLALTIVLGWMLPVMGISLVILLGVDILRWRCHQNPGTEWQDVESRHQSPLGIVRSRVATRRKETRRFLCGVGVLALIVLTVMSRAIIGGVIDEYNIPFSAWSASMYITQGCMIVLYTLVFTALLSIPLWYFFLGEEEQKGS